MLPNLVNNFARSTVPRFVQWSVKSNKLVTKIGNKRRFTTGTGLFRLDRNSLPKRVLDAQYAVRGPIVLKAYSLEAQLRDGVSKLPFQRIHYCNIGNPHDMGQKPLSHPREVLSHVENPALLHNAGSGSAEAKRRAKHMLYNIKGGTGSYTASRGLEFVLQDISKFITHRDGVDVNDAYKYCKPENIFMSNGASDAISTTLQMLINDENDGIMIPIPQYPLYSATITLLGGSLLPYYLDESQGWGLTTAELERSYSEAVANGKKPKAMVVINPGNPTGQVLPFKNMQDIVQFCISKNLPLLADEVYQENVYYPSTKPWYSFKQIKHSIGPTHHDLPLFSFHSVSKGVWGECGKRGGYVEMDSVPYDWMTEFYKLRSIGLCPNVLGQLMVDMMVNPPSANSTESKAHILERTEIYNDLKYKAELIVATLNSFPGVTCNAAEGAMYAFPRIHFSEKAIETAREKGEAPDVMYCNELLEQTGICTVPGSGFGQAPGTYHLRTTFLPQRHDLPEILGRWTDFHNAFVTKYE